jgi:tRNA (guanine-N7-)-methyltransferase
MPKRVRNHVNPLSILKEHSFEGFENDNPLVVDVGACKGEFVEALALKFPDKNFIAFEIRVPLARKLEERFREMPNLVVFDGDAGRNFRSILGPSLERGVLVETIYVNFPDPWFKDKHKKRRFVNAKFLEDMDGFLPSETEFVFQTDQKFLFDETLEVLQESAYTDIQYFDESPHGVQTDWESAKRKEGDRIYRMRFRK